MTLSELRVMLAHEPASSDHLEVKVWLPGSTISLTPGPGLREGSMIRRGQTLLIEGNVDEGSALGR